MQRLLSLLLPVSLCWLPSIAAAQAYPVPPGNPTHSYNGYDGPPSSPRANSDFLANRYGNRIVVVARGGDGSCFRSFYVDGTITMGAGLTGTFVGKMSRCTNPELFDCDHLISYEIPCSGTVTATLQPKGYSIQLDYMMEIWNLGNCKWVRDEPRTDQLELHELAQPQPLPSPRQRVSRHYDRVVQTGIDSIQGLGQHDLLRD